MDDFTDESDAPDESEFEEFADFDDEDFDEEEMDRYTPAPKNSTLEELGTCSNTVRCLAKTCRAVSICNAAKEKPVTLIRCDNCSDWKIVVKNKYGNWAELSSDDMEWDMSYPEDTDCQEVKDIWADLNKCSDIEKIELSDYDIKTGGETGFSCKSCDEFNHAPADWDKDD